MKQCSKCNESKSLSEFYTLTRSKDGHRPDCKTCHMAVKKAGYPKRNARRNIRRKVDAEYRDRCNLYQRGQHTKHAAEQNQTRRERYNTDSEYKERMTLQRHKSYAKNGYKYRESQWRKQGIHLTFTQYNTMLDVRGHVCEMCKEGNVKNGVPYNLVVDHSHVTGKIRGLLCDRCNHRLGRIDKHGFTGNHQCGPAFAANAFVYLLSTTLRNGFITHPTKQERELSTHV